MATYQIIIYRYEDDAVDTPTGQVIITAHTQYTLLTDIPEWVTEEIDDQADVQEIPVDSIKEIPRELDPKAWEGFNPPIDRDKCPVTKAQHDWNLSTGRCNECGIARGGDTQ